MNIIEFIIIDLINITTEPQWVGYLLSVLINAVLTVIFLKVLIRFIRNSWRD
jgi:hypothetical protein